MSKSDRLKKQVDFIVALDRAKEVYRQNYIADASRRENDAEHSWHIAVMAYVLAEYAPEGTGISRAILMCLVHDIIEIDAGDTYAYDYEAAKTKDEREKQGADHLFGLLPPDQGEYLRALWEEFEQYETPDARYAHLLDNFQPLLLNDASGGKSWAEHGAKKSWIYKRNERTPETSPTIWEMMSALIDENIKKGNIKEG